MSHYNPKPGPVGGTNLDPFTVGVEVKGIGRPHSKPAGASRLLCDREPPLPETEAILPIANGRLAEVFDGLADGIFINRAVSDESGQIVDFIVEYANEAACHLTGLRRDEMVGRRVLDLFPKQRENGQFDAYVRVVETGETLVRRRVRDLETPSRSQPDRCGLSYVISVTKLGGDRCLATLHNISALERAEEDLARAQQLLRVVLDNIPQRVFWKDRSSVFLGSNYPYAHDAGLADPSELIGKTDYDMTWSSEAERYRADDIFVMETGEPKLKFEEPQPRPDGTVGWIRTSKVPLRDGSGAVIGVLGTYEDVTEQKLAEEALFESEEKLRLILDSVPQRIFWKDRQGRFLGANAAFIRDLGLTDPNEIVGKTDFDIGDGDASAAYRADDQQVIETGQPILTYEEPSVRPDGSHGWVRTSKLPLRDRTGAVVGILGTFEDITESKTAEEALRKSEQLLDSIVENIPDMVFVKDARDLKFVRVNQAEERLLGISREEILSGENRQESTPAEVEFFEAIDRQVLDTGDIVDIPEERLTTIHGVRILHTIKVPIMNEDGRPRYLLGISEDITDLKLAEVARLETEERYRRIVDTISDYVVSVKIENGRVVETAHGAGCFALTGYTAEEFTRAPGLWMSLIVADDYAAAQEQTRLILAGEQPEPLEHRIVRRDGAIRWVRQTPVIRTNADGVHVGYDGVIQDITESRELQEQLLQSANLDGLTGAGNRRLMDFELSQLMSSVRQTGQQAAIVMIDIDQFKLYNDSHGHGAGDLVLVDVAKSIQQSIRPDDRLYRYGGEEFLVSLRASTLQGAVLAADRIVRHVARQAISHPANQPWGVVTISAGAALMTPDQGSLAAVLAEADKALYESKANGRNRVSQGPGS